MSRPRSPAPEVFPEAFAALGVRSSGDLVGRLGEVQRAASKDTWVLSDG